MKTTLKLLTSSLLLMLVVTSCANKIIDNDLIINDDLDENLFFYNGNEKIYLQQVKDKILLTFTLDARTEQIEAIMDNYSSLKLIDDFYFGNEEEHPFISAYAAYYDKNNKPISLETIESLKKHTDVVAVTYLLKIKGKNNKLLGLQDYFIAETSSYAKMQELAEKYDCRIKTHPYLSGYLIHVCKTSGLNAMQTANIFYESGHFTFAEPSLLGYSYTSNSNY